MISVDLALGAVGNFVYLKYPRCEKEQPSGSEMAWVSDRLYNDDPAWSILGMPQRLPILPLAVLTIARGVTSF